MPFGNEAGPTMVYSYRAYRPTSGLDAVTTEMHRRTRLWNTLVEIDRDYRDRARALTGPRPWAEATKADPEIVPQLDLLDVERRQRVREACRDSGLHWANADDVRVSYEQAIKQPQNRPLWRLWTDKRDDRHAEPNDLQFHSGRLGGRLVVRVPKTRRWFTLHPCTNDGNHTPSAVCELRIGKAGEAATIPVRMHRRLPEDAVIQRAELSRQTRGYREDWTLALVVRTDTAIGSPSPNPRAVTIRFGWELCTDGSMEVARWESDDGESGGLSLPAELLASFRHVAGLQSVRQQHFNAAQALVAKTRRTPDGLPSWLVKGTEFVGLWNTPERLCRLMDRWHHEGGGESDEYTLLQRWARREHHLATEETNLRTRLLRRREWLYGNVAAQLCRDYGAIRMGAPDLRRIARRRRHDDQSEEERWQRFIAGISTLRMRIMSTARRTGVVVLSQKVGVPPQKGGLGAEEPGFERNR
jgi:hypothetical protein